MDDWGLPGPVLGPFRFAHTTYAADIKLGDEGIIEVSDDMIHYDGIYYGDWSVFDQSVLDESKDLQARLEKFDEEKTRIPETNTKFIYLYRDACNYKRHGAVVFAGKYSGGREALFTLVRDCLDGGGFIARQIDVPDVFLFQDGHHTFDPFEDHCWHEFVGVEEVTEEPNDARGIEEFVSTLKAAKGAWVAYNVEEEN